MVRTLAYERIRPYVLLVVLCTYLYTLYSMNVRTLHTTSCRYIFTYNFFTKVPYLISQCSLAPKIFLKVFFLDWDFKGTVLTRIKVDIAICIPIESSFQGLMSPIVKAKPFIHWIFFG